MAVAPDGIVSRPRCRAAGGVADRRVVPPSFRIVAQRGAPLPGAGCDATPRPRLARPHGMALRQRRCDCAQAPRPRNSAARYACFTGMLGRLILGATIMKGQRWFASPVPTLFHLVLAADLIVYGHFHFRQRHRRSVVNPRCRHDRPSSADCSPGCSTRWWWPEPSACPRCCSFAGRR